MDKEKITQQLNQLFAEKLSYNGEFESLFIIERDMFSQKLKIQFLNKQHYNFILKHLKNELLNIVGDGATLRYLNLKTNHISLKSHINEENPVIKISPIKKKEKVELPTIKNKTIKQIEEFMFLKHKKYWEKQKEIIAQYEDDGYLENKEIFFLAGQIQFIANLYCWMKEIKDYEE